MPDPDDDPEVIGNAAAVDYLETLTGRRLSINTWKGYVHQHRKLLKPHRRQETDSGHALPVWRQSTIRKWQESRPGQGRRRAETSQ